MATPVFKSGRGGTATISGNAIPITGWEVNPTTKLVEFWNSLTGRFGDIDFSFHQCLLTINLDRDFANNPFAAPISIVQGTILTNVILTEDGTLAWTFPLMGVTGTPHTLVIDGKDTLRVMGRNKGPYTAPGGIAPPA